MKIVYSNSELPHLWIHNKQDYARNANGSISFNKNKYYSYDLCIGALHNNTVFIYNSTYSNTTARHISQLLSACSHKNIVYCLNPECVISGYHESNLNNMLSLMQDSIKNLDRKRKKEKYLSIFEDKYTEYKNYIQVLNLPIHKEIEDLYETIINNTAEYTAKIKLERELKEKENTEKFNEKLKLWRNNEIAYFDNYSNKYTYLRWKDNKIETSKRISIPKNIAEYIWNNIQNKVYVAGDKVHNSLFYSIDKITDTYIKIGCHTITFKEMKKVWNE